MALQDAAVEDSTEALRDAVLVSSPWLYKIRQCKGALHILCIVGKGGLADLKQYYMVFFSSKFITF